MDIKSSIHSMCFNRYMVECEYRTFINFRTVLVVLIDTWWNVNVRDEITFDFANQF